MSIYLVHIGNDRATSIMASTDKLNYLFSNQIVQWIIRDPLLVDKLLSVNEITRL